MTDILLKEFFKKERWESGIDIGVGKRLNRGLLKQFTSPSVRIELYERIKNDKYAIAPPHTALIPKDKPNEFREVLICEDIDRIVLSIINNIFFDMFPEYVHKSCTSYQKGIGCGKVVQRATKELQSVKTEIVGMKYDLSKYFDSVPLYYIDSLFDSMEQKYGKSKIIDIVRAFYHSNLLFDPDGNLIEEYKSMKQGTATSSFIADAILFDVDKALSETKDIFYVRYSDDILILGNGYKDGDKLLHFLLEKKTLALNPKKIQSLKRDEWFKFLGFSIKGDGSLISLSQSRIKTFQKEIEKRTIKSKNSLKGAINEVNRYLYIGDGQFSWATNVLPIVNCEEDINTLNLFVLDSLRAVATNKRKVGGLGFTNTLSDKVILRGTGKNVKANKIKYPDAFDKYKSIKCMQNALFVGKTVYDTLVREM